MRVKLFWNLASNTLVGITPAHAGKTVLEFGIEYLGWDHPRACG